METRARKYRFAASIAVAAVLLFAAQAVRAEGEEPSKWFPAGSVIVEPSGESTIMSEGFGTSTRADVDIVNAEFELNRVITAKLVECSKTVVTLTSNKGFGWLSAAKWISLGVALFGSFTLGAVLL